MRRPFKEFIQLGPGVSQLEGGTQARPGYAATVPTRRKFKELIQVGGRVDSCQQWVTHRYYSATGKELWRADHGTTVRAIAVDPDGNVYTAGGAAPGTSKLVKWSAAGKQLWTVPVNSDIGRDVACDATGNVWLATGTALQKYSSRGELLAEFTTIIWPEWTVTHTYLYVPDISRVAVSPSGKVVFGTGGFEVTSSSFNINRPSINWLTGNTMDLDGGNQAAFVGTGIMIPADSLNSLLNPDFVLNLHFNKYDFDSAGNFYFSCWFSVTPAFTGGFYYICGQALKDTPEIYSYNGILVNNFVGYAQERYDPTWYPFDRSGGQFAVHRPSGKVLMAFGYEGAGEIKDLPTIIPTHGLPYLQDQPAVITEVGAGMNSVLRVNDNHRYVYSVNAAHCTHRVRTYPDKFEWQADHKVPVLDAVIKADNTVLIAGNRVFDDCVPAPKGAMAGITSTGVVTVYELDGTLRWQAQVLDAIGTEYGLANDITFDAVGGIWARRGDGMQLVHTDPTGIIVSNVELDSLTTGRQPTIASLNGTLVYVSFPASFPGGFPRVPTEVARGPNGALLSGVVQISASSVGIAYSGRIAGWGGHGVCYVWDIDGTLLYELGVGGETIISGTVDPVQGLVYLLTPTGFWTLNMQSGAQDFTAVSNSSQFVLGWAPTTGFVIRSYDFSGQFGLIKYDWTIGGAVCNSGQHLQFIGTGHAYADVSISGSWTSCAGLK
jgi:hypothetical protein